MRKTITRAKIGQIVSDSLGELFTNDLSLLEDDASERSITHKLAEYLQKRIPDMHIDCEYNRNAALGEGAPKTLHILKTKLIDLQSDELRADD